MSTAIEVGEADFEARVVEASRTKPVVVDFWAGWCQPCLILGPMLERLAEEHSDRFVLAKVDVDANPGLAQVFGVQGIPAVKAFRDGQVVSEFVGVQPEDMLRRFLEEVAPDEAGLEEARRAAREAVEERVRQIAGEGGEVGIAAADVLEGDERGALDRLLKVVGERGPEADAARLAALAIFELLGEEDPRTGEYRRRLASLLF